MHENPSDSWKWNFASEVWKRELPQWRMTSSVAVFWELLCSAASVLYVVSRERIVEGSQVGSEGFQFALNSSDAGRIRQSY